MTGQELPQTFDPDELPVAEPGPADDDTIAGEPREPRAAPATTAPQFNYNDRLYALAQSRSGKSEILNVIFSGVACQRLLIDTKPEFAIPDVEPVHTPEAIDWTEPIIHYQPIAGSDASQYEQIFAVALTRRGLLVCCHELAALVDYKPGKAGPALIGYLSQGGALGLGALMGSQRPRLIPAAGLTEANHVIVLPPQLARREDNVAAAEALSPVDGELLSVQDLFHELAALHQDSGLYSFLWKDRHRGTLQAFPPLPESVRRLSIVRRLEDA